MTHLDKTLGELVFLKIISKRHEHGSEEYEYARFIHGLYAQFNGSGLGDELFPILHKAEKKGKRLYISKKGLRRQQKILKLGIMDAFPFKLSDIKMK